MSKTKQHKPDELFPLLYEELRRLAHGFLRRSTPNQTLVTTALINEAYLRIQRNEKLKSVDQTHFLCVSATAMRQILIDHARRRKALKRGGAEAKVELDQALLLFEQKDLDLLDLDQALQRLEAHDSGLAQVVEMRFFGGLAEKEIAAALKLSARAVRERWRLAKLWLKREMGKEDAA